MERRSPGTVGEPRGRGGAVTAAEHTAETRKILARALGARGALADALAHATVAAARAAALSPKGPR